MQIWTKTILKPTAHQASLECRQLLCGSRQDVGHSRRWCFFSRAANSSYSQNQRFNLHGRWDRPLASAALYAAVPVNDGASFCVQRYGTRAFATRGFFDLLATHAKRNSAANIYSDELSPHSTVSDCRRYRQLPAADSGNFASIHQTISRFRDSIMRRNRNQKKTNQNEKRNANQRVTVRRSSDCDRGRWPIGRALCRAGQSR